MSRHGLHVTDPAKIIIGSSADHIKVGGLTFLDRHPHGGLMTPQNVGVDFFHFALKSE